MNEKEVQNFLRIYVMHTKKHHSCIANSTVILPWEADFISITNSGLLHEYEIKLSYSDFKADFKKKSKHNKISRKSFGSGTYYFGIPNYFWYATYELDNLDIPDYAGWIKLEKNRIKIIKNAPRLHTNKIRDKEYKKIARLLSFRRLD